MTMPDWMKVGALVKGIGFTGRIEDIMYSNSGRVVIKVSSPKAARLVQSHDLLDYTEAPQLWIPATVDELHRDAETEILRANRSIKAIEEYMKLVTSPETPQGGLRQASNRRIEVQYPIHSE